MAIPSARRFHLRARGRRRPNYPDEPVGEDHNHEHPEGCRRELENTNGDVADNQLRPRGHEGDQDRGGDSYGDRTQGQTCTAAPLLGPNHRRVPPKALMGAPACPAASGP